MDVHDVRPALRGHIHAVAWMVSAPAGASLVLSAERLSARLAAGVYVVSLLLVFGISAVYHWSRRPRVRTVMRRLDHSMIYLLIAGTYTPVCVLALPPAWGIPLLVAQAAGAMVGVVLKLLDLRWAGSLGHALYPLLSWMVVPAGPVLASMVNPLQFALLVGGTLIYSIGLPVLCFRKPNPWPTMFGYHEVWHVFTVVAAAMHFAGVATLVT